MIWLERARARERERARARERESESERARARARERERVGLMRREATGRVGSKREFNTVKVGCGGL
jgi:hypothetical protein